MGEGVPRPEWWNDSRASPVGQGTRLRRPPDRTLARRPPVPLLQADALPRRRRVGRHAGGVTGDGPNRLRDVRRGYFDDVRIHGDAPVKAVLDAEGITQMAACIDRDQQTRIDLFGDPECGCATELRVSAGETTIRFAELPDESFLSDVPERMPDTFEGGRFRLADGEPAPTVVETTAASLSRIVDAVEAVDGATYPLPRSPRTGRNSTCRGAASPRAPASRDDESRVRPCRTATARRSPAPFGRSKATSDSRQPPDGPRHHRQRERRVYRSHRRAGALAASTTVSPSTTTL